MHAVLFVRSYLLAIAIEQIHVIHWFCINWSINKIHQVNQINGVGNTLLTHTKLYTQFGTDSHKIIYPANSRGERSKTTPCPAVHPRIPSIFSYGQPPVMANALIVMF